MRVESLRSSSTSRTLRFGASIFCFLPAPDDLRSVFTPSFSVLEYPRSPVCIRSIFPHYGHCQYRGSENHEDDDNDSMMPVLVPVMPVLLVGPQHQHGL